MSAPQPVCAPVHKRDSAENNKKRVLIGSCGGLTGIYLARQLSQNPALELFGADADSDSPGRFFVSKLLVLPRANEDGYINRLCSVLRDYCIDYYLPTHSEEMRIAARHESVLRATGAKFLISSLEAFSALDDKAAACLSLSSIGVPVPSVYEDISEITSYPVFVKRKVGSGSKGAAIVNSELELRSLLGKDSSCAAFQYIDGEEYTVDCMFDNEGTLLAYNQRERVKTLGGAVVITRNANPIDVSDYLKRIGAHWLLRGCVNFQYILSSGIPWFIDVNLRYASGGLPLSVASGVNVPEMVVRLLGGETILPGEYHSDNLPRTMYRYFEEVFEVRS